MSHQLEPCPSPVLRSIELYTTTTVSHPVENTTTCVSSSPTQLSACPHHQHNYLCVLITNTTICVSSSPTQLPVSSSPTELSVFPHHQHNYLCVLITNTTICMSSSLTELSVFPHHQHNYLCVLITNTTICMSSSLTELSVFPHHQHNYLCFLITNTTILCVLITPLSCHPSLGIHQSSVVYVLLFCFVEYLVGTDCSRISVGQ